MAKAKSHLQSQGAILEATASKTSILVANARPQASAPSDQVIATVSFTDVLIVVVWWAALAAMAETSQLLSTCFIKNSFLFSSPHVLWMNFFMQCTVVGIACIPVYCIARKFRQASLGLITMFAAFVGSVALLAAFSQLSLLAILFLAMGITVQVVRKTDAHPNQFLKFYRSTVGLLAGSVVASAVVGTIAFYSGTGQVADMTVPTPSGATPPKQPPNVLMIVLDTVSHEALFDGDNIGDNTPYLKKLAGESLVYESAYSTSPWTLPSHASLLTGQLPSQHNASWTTALPSHVPTITQWLLKQNYQTGAFVANHWYCSRETGIGRGFGHFDDEQITASTFLSAAAWSRRFVPVMLGCVGIVSDPCKTQRRSAATIHQRAERWIRSKSKQPWFAMVNLFDAHDPYIAPGTRNQLSDLEFRKLKFWWDRNKQNVSDSNVKLQQTKYRECLAYLDKEIGRFLNRLIETSHLKNTIVIITADHGEHFGDHDLYGHGNSLYQPLIHIPLMIWASPDLEQRKGVEKQNVSLCDIPATISNLVSPNSSHPFPGNDLLTKNSSATPVFSEIQTPSLWPACHGRSPVFRGAMKCVVWNGYKYIRTGEDEEVYKISTDEAESVNLIDHVEANTLTELRLLINKQYPPQ